MAILQEGMKANVLGLPNKDMEFIALGNYTVEDIARWWSVPPHKIGSLLRATFSNIDQQSLEYVIYSLIPILRMKEVEFGRKILLPQDQDRYFLRYNVDALLRGDPEKRASALQTQFINGALQLDEWRDLEDRNPLADGLGKNHFVPRNLIPVEQAIQGPQPVASKPAKPAAPPAPAESRSTIQMQSVRKGFELMYSQTYQRLGRKEAMAARAAARKPSKFIDWIDEFYPEHASVLIEAIQPTMEMQLRVVEQVEEPQVPVLANRKAQRLADARCNASREKLLTLSECKASELAHVVEGFARECESTLPGIYASEDAGANHAL